MDDTRSTNAPEPAATKSRGLRSYFLWGFVVVMLYVLSSGPMMKLGLTRKLIQYRPYIRKVYAPLVWAHERTPLWRPLGMYWHLWLPAVYAPDGSTPASFRARFLFFPFGDITDDPF